jgi:uncharacterized cupin superfamily protein
MSESENDVKVTVTRIEDIAPRHANTKAPFESFIRRVTPGESKRMEATFMTIPPGKSFCPYHYHTHTEELFYIISGTGLLRTPEGEREVKAGDAAFFPAGENGAHRITNVSETEDLVYLDADAAYDPDICVYPDSGKVGIYGREFNGIYTMTDEADYYENEGDL